MMEEHRKQEIAFCYPDIEGDHIGIGRLSEKQREINRIKNIAMSSLDSAVRMAAIDALSVYGNEAIEPITQIIEDERSDSNVKQHGLKAIQMIRAIYR
jgi:hypothetical protein